MSKSLTEMKRGVADIEEEIARLAVGGGRRSRQPAERPRITLRPRHRSREALLRELRNRYARRRPRLERVGFHEVVRVARGARLGSLRDIYNARFNSQRTSQFIPETDNVFTPLATTLLTNGNDTRVNEAREQYMMGQENTTHVLHGELTEPVEDEYEEVEEPPSPTGVVEYHDYEL